MSVIEGVGLDLTSTPDARPGTYVCQSGGGEFVRTPSKAECPYCHRLMQCVDYGKPFVRVAVRVENNGVGHFIPDTHVVLHCGPCEQTFTLPKGLA